MFRMDGGLCWDLHRIVSVVPHSLAGGIGILAAGTMVWGVHEVRAKGLPGATGGV
jgi:hypothetical protein